MKTRKPEDEQPTLGEQEIAVLRYIAARAPVTARDVVAKFAGEQELARTTILTKIERLRKKGFVTRCRQDGVFYYAPRLPQADVLRGLVRDFVEKTLGGSFSPVLAYLIDTRELSEAELAVLRRLAADLPGDPEPAEGETS